MSKGLRVSQELSLPLEFATKSAAILAQRRKGKSYTAAVLAEECVAANIPFVILDPTGAHWGLRASADGRRKGLPVYVFGGEHPSDSELTLERTAGKVIADFVVDYPGYYVIDFKGFDSKEAERQFATDFAERLYRYKGQPGKDFVMHLFVDEADLFVPQRSPRGDERMLGAFESIVRRGGIRGLGTTLISQRAAVVNKNVLEQIDILIALRTVGPNDREAIRKYVVANGDPDEVSVLMGSLASLDLGEAWVYEPGGEPPLFDRVRIRERHTFNSSATPKAGENRIEPVELADVELAALRERMASTIERRKSEDPKELKRRIAELERAASIVATPPPVIERIEVQVLDAELVSRVEKAVQAAVIASDGLGKVLEVLNQRLYDARPIEAKRTPRVEERPGPSSRSAVERPPLAREVPVQVRGAGASSTELGKAERTFLTVLAQHGPQERNALATLAGYSVKSGHVDNVLGGLRSKGLVEKGWPARPSDEGLRLLGDWEPLPTGAALRDYWLGHSQVPKAGAAFLRVLFEHYPRGISRDELAVSAGYEVNSGHVDNTLGRLRTMGLAVGHRLDIRAASMLFD